jgi:hypothetical protein
VGDSVRDGFVGIRDTALADVEEAVELVVNKGPASEDEVRSAVT